MRYKIGDWVQIKSEKEFSKMKEYKKIDNNYFKVDKFPYFVEIMNKHCNKFLKIKVIEQKNDFYLDTEPRYYFHSWMFKSTFNKYKLKKLLRK